MPTECNEMLMQAVHLLHHCLPEGVSQAQQTTGGVEGTT